MKICGIPCVLATLIACSSPPAEETKRKEITLDSLKLMHESDLSELDSNWTNIDYMFQNTAQRVFVRSGYPDGAVTVSVDDARLPQSGRSDLPRKWKTALGVYAGMPIDSLQMINGKPFYIEKKDGKLRLMNWEEGRLSGNGLAITFSIEQGGEVEAPISSQELIDRKWIVRGAEVSLLSAYFWKEPAVASGGLEGDYTFASIRELTEADVAGRNRGELGLMRNEIFARHGFIFESDLRNHFQSKPWYQPRFNNVDDKLTAIEKKNIAFLAKAENDLTESLSIRALVKRLPLLHLPFDLETEHGGITLDADLPAPDGSISGVTDWRAVHGLLPDTSRIYAVVWKGEGDFTVAGRLPAMYVTTLDKQFNLIDSKPVVLFTQIDEYGSDCHVDGTTVSTLNKDWSFYSEYKADISCPDGDGATTSSTDTRNLSGSISEDGSITVSNAGGDHAADYVEERGEDEDEVKTEVCIFEDAAMGDCYYLSFSCMEFGNAKIDESMPAEQRALWKNLTIDNNGVEANPEYKGKTFEITYSMIHGRVCGDPSVGEQTALVPFVMGIKLK